MGIVKRQSFKASIVSYIGIGIGALNMVILFPLLLAPEEIGFIEALRAIAFILVPFAEFGLPSYTNKFFPYYSDSNQQHKGFLSFIILIFISGFSIISLLFLLFSDIIIEAYRESAPMLADYIWYIIPLTFYVAFFGITSAYSASLMRIVVPNILQNIILRFLTLCVIIAYYFNLITFPQFIFLFINVYAIPVILMFLYINFLKNLFLNIKWQLFNINNLKTLGSFSFFVVFSSASGMLVSKIDVVMLSYLSGLQETGIYAIAFFIGSVIEIPKRSLSTIALPILSAIFKENDIASVQKLYRSTSINQLVIGIFLFLLIWLNIDTLFQFIPNGEIYQQGKHVVFFIGLGKIIDMLMGCNLEIMIASKYFRFNLYSTLFLAVTTILNNLLLIPSYGITGAAMASAISLLIFNLINFFYIKYRYNLQPFSTATIKGLAVGVIVFAIAQIIPDFGNKFLNIIVTSAVITLLYTGMIYFLKISEDINQVIDQFLAWSKKYK